MTSRRRPAPPLTPEEVRALQDLEDQVLAILLDLTEGRFDDYLDFEAEYHGELKLIYSREAGTLGFECEIQHPPSSKGRTIYVWFSGEDLTDALKALRDEAIRARAQPLQAETDG